MEVISVWSNQQNLRHIYWLLIGVGGGFSKLEAVTFDLQLIK